jgi:hypothetical protein
VRRSWCTIATHHGQHSTRMCGHGCDSGYMAGGRASSCGGAAHGTASVPRRGTSMQGDATGKAQNGRSRSSCCPIA